MTETISERIPGDGFFLRRWKVEDAAWYVSSRDVFNDTATTERRELTIAETEAAILRINASMDALCFAIVDSAEDALIGNIALAVDADQANTAEIMYWLSAAARGRGIATRAVILLGDWAFQSLGLERITLKVLSGNLRSRRVAERAGFRQLKEGDAGYVWYEWKNPLVTDGDVK